MSGVTLPAGVYFIGDPMYVLDKDEWHDMVYLSESIYEPELHFWHHKTDVGDGVYYDQEDHRYFVDSASIGVVPISMFTKDTKDVSSKKIGLVYEFKNDFTCDYDDGVFKIDDIVIDTRLM